MVGVRLFAWDTSVVFAYSDLCTRGEKHWGSWRIDASFGLSPGDRVAIVMTNVPEYLPVLFGIWWAGLVAVPVNARLHAREVQLHPREFGGKSLLHE